MDCIYKRFKKRYISCFICHSTNLEIALMWFGYRFEMEDKWKVFVFYFKEHGTFLFVLTCPERQ